MNRIDVDYATSDRTPGRRGLSRIAGLIGSTLLAAGLATGGNAQEESIQARLQAAVDNVVADTGTNFTGTVVYASRPGVGSWSVAAGVADTAIGNAVSPDARFRAGSVMKPFVAVVILQLLEEGYVTLDQPITELLPASVTDRFVDADRITVRMLLNHTSGLPEWSTDEVDAATVADPLRILGTDYVLDVAAAQTPTFAPGEGYSYSNTDYNLLGLIIEEITGESWRAAIRERVFDRIGLQNTFLPEPGDPVLPEPAMHGYQFLTDGPVDITTIDPSMAGAAGGSALVTTAADLAAFLDALRAGALFADPGTFALMSDFSPAPDDGFQDGYGFGFQHLVLPGGIEMIGHYGVTAGYFAITGYFPALDLTVAAAINAWPADPSTVLFAVLQVFADEAAR
jgi:D-alanyl-D-alanine carboxypeptidase